MKAFFQSQYGIVAMILVTWLATQPISVHCIDDECQLCCEKFKIFYGRVWSPDLIDIVYSNCMRECTGPGSVQTETPTTPVPTTPRPTTTTAPKKFCGLQTRNSARIVGGVGVGECEFPWVVGIAFYETKFCGGSVVDRRHVITAAHCVKNVVTGIVSPSNITIRYGSSALLFQTSVNVTRILPHPLHNDTTKDYDVAVLTLAEDLVYDECVSPICLPDVNSDPKEGDICTAAGWGNTRYPWSWPQTTLLKVDLPIVDQKICSDAYIVNGRSLINELKLCAGDFLKGGIGTCQGDSGGPLMCETDGAFYLHGITSFGRNCALPGYPDVYTRVANPEIMDFIKEGISDIPRDS